MTKTCCKKCYRSDEVSIICANANCPCHTTPKAKVCVRCGNEKPDQVHSCQSRDSFFELDELIRDLTKVGSIPKSEAKRRILARENMAYEAGYAAAKKNV